MIVGDTHGGIDNIAPKIQAAGEAGIQHVLVVGDFGIWDHIFEGTLFLDRVQAAAQENNLSVFAVGGNHENWDHWEWYMQNMPKSNGWAYVRSRVLLAPKVHRWRWAGKQFVGAGGAVSIDKNWRLERESGFFYDQYTGRHIQRSPAPRTLWWDNEQLSDEDVKEIDAWNLKADYLITHDASSRTPFHTDLIPDFASAIHRQRIDDVLKSIKPEAHFHGHYHAKFDWENLVAADGDAHYAHTYGLDCNAHEFSWGTLDVETGRFVWKDTKFRD